MSLSLGDTITKLLKGGIEAIHIGMSPNKKPFVVVEQQVLTGRQGNQTKVIHQREDASIVNAFEAIARDVEYCDELKSKVVTLDESN